MTLPPHFLDTPWMCAFYIKAENAGQEAGTMDIRKTRVASEIVPLKLSMYETPHAVLEPNYTCNRRCALCYNRYRDIVKPLATVCKEVDALCAKRNLETISILGGEPTLHPDLPEIVRHVKSRGVYCQILTNGVLLAKEGGEKLLTTLVEAGVDRILIHVDTGQGLSEGEVERMRENLAGRLERARVNFGMSITMYEGREDDIAPLMKRYARFRYFDGILATIGREGDGSKGQPMGGPDPFVVYSWIRADLGVEPVSYLPSNLSDFEARWLIYFYYLNAENGKSACISPAYSRLLKRVYRATCGRQLFAVPMKPALTPVWFLLTSLVEGLRSPRRILPFLRLIRGSHALRSLRFQYIVLQTPALTRVGEKEIEMCYHCPDATIRNGRLTPVCVADWISPPAGRAMENPANLPLAQAVYAHLEQDPLPAPGYNAHVEALEESLTA